MHSRPLKPGMLLYEIGLTPRSKFTERRTLPTNESENTMKKDQPMYV